MISLPRRSPSAALVAVITVALALIWLVVDVQWINKGHLSGLFYTGSAVEIPPGWLAGHTYQVSDEKGYDGQFYRFIAHDPLNRQGVLQHVDGPRYRWRRIGLPGLAYVLAFGEDEWIDAAYVGWQLLFVFLGAYWLAHYAEVNRWSTAWGLGFLLIPAAAISLDRMTVDLPLAALSMAVLLYASLPEVSWIAYVALAAAPLFRETGALLILAWCAYWIVKGASSSSFKNVRRALLGAACMLPAVGWWAYVAGYTTPDPTPFLASFPFDGLITWTLHALREPVAVYGPRANAVTELIALAGIWLAYALVIYVLIDIAATRRLDRGKWELPELTVIAFGAFASLIGYQDIWASAYGIGRTLSPLLIALAAIALRDRRIIFALPMLLIVPRIALQFGAEIKVAWLTRLS